MAMLMMMIFSREEKTSIVPTLFLDRWWTQSSRRRRRNSSHKKVFWLRLCASASFFRFSFVVILYTVYSLVHTPQLYMNEMNKNPSQSNFYRRLKISTLIIWYEREREKKTHSRYLRSSSLKMKRDVTKWLSLYESETQLLLMDDICFFVFMFMCPFE